MDPLKNMSHNKHVHGLPKLKIKKYHLCDACQVGKQIKSSLKPKNVISTSRSLPNITYGLLVLLKQPA